MSAPRCMAARLTCRVLALEPMPDASGRAMSRGLGNLVEPMALIERFGADVIRWCLCRGAGR